MKLVASSSLSDSFWARKSKSSPPDTLQDTSGGVGARPWVQLLRPQPFGHTAGSPHPSLGFCPTSTRNRLCFYLLHSSLWIIRAGTALRGSPEGSRVTLGITSPHPVTEGTETVLCSDKEEHMLGQKLEAQVLVQLCQSPWAIHFPPSGRS